MRSSDTFQIILDACIVSQNHIRSRRFRPIPGYLSSLSVFIYLSFSTFHLCFCESCHDYYQPQKCYKKNWTYTFVHCRKFQMVVFNVSLCFLIWCYFLANDLKEQTVGTLFQNLMILLANPFVQWWFLYQDNCIVWNTFTGQIIMQILFPIFVKSICKRKWQLWNDERWRAKLIFQCFFEINDNNHILWG